MTDHTQGRPLTGRSTPSGWHDRGYRRGQSHDQMQAEFMAFLRGRVVVNPSSSPMHKHVEAEYALMKRGEVVAFADAIEIVTVGLNVSVSIFELKPKIDTVFGIVRQAKALLSLARTQIPGDVHVVHVVAPHDDPLLSILREEWPHTWAWGIDL